MLLLTYLKHYSRIWFYEWQAIRRQEAAFFFFLTDGPLSFAAIWDTARQGEQANR